MTIILFKAGPRYDGSLHWFTSTEVEQPGSKTTAINNAMGKNLYLCDFMANLFPVPGKPDFKDYFKSVLKYFGGLLFSIIEVFLFL
jgi:hypothetical protein